MSHDSAIIFESDIDYIAEIEAADEEVLLHRYESDNVLPWEFNKIWGK